MVVTPVKSWRHALQKTVGNDVHVVDDARHHVALRVRIGVPDGRGGEAVKGVLAQVAHQLITERIDEVVQQFLRRKREQDAQREPARHIKYLRKIDLPRADHRVDRPAVQHRPEQDERHIQ